MAENRWRGDSPAVAQKDKIVVGGSITGGGGDTATVTINGKNVTYTTVSGDTLTTATANFVALLAASGIAEFLDAQWAVDGTTATQIDVSATTVGVPYIFTTSVTGAITLTPTNLTANSGPSVANVAANWTLNHTPTGTDAIVIDGNDGGAPILYGLGSSFTVASVDIRASWTNQIGLPARNTSNGGYYEYRTRFATWNCTTGTIGSLNGPGSGQMYLGIVAASTWTVYKTGSPSAQAAPAVDFISSGNPTLISVIGGTVGLCVTDESTTPTVATVTVTGQNANFWQGAGTTVTTLTNNGGNSLSRGTIATLNMANSGKHVQALGNVSTLISASSGYITLQSTGTTTTVTLQSQGAGINAVTLDCTSNDLARTFTNTTFTGGSAILDPNKTVTFTNNFTTDAASIAASNLGPTFTGNRT